MSDVSMIASMVMFNNKGCLGLGIVLLILSFICLLPGLMQPMLTIQAEMQMMGMRLSMLDETRSILQTVDSLYQQGHRWVAALIALFSIVVPFIKGAALLLMVCWRQPVWRQRISTWIGMISKWSMADVFVVAVFVAYLSAQANAYLAAELHAGFYYFLSYCLLSILATQCIQHYLHHYSFRSDNHL